MEVFYKQVLRSLTSDACLSKWNLLIWYIDSRVNMGIVPCLCLEFGGPLKVAAFEATAFVLATRLVNILISIFGVDAAKVFQYHLP